MQKPKIIFHAPLFAFSLEENIRESAPKASSSRESPVADVCRSPQRADTSSSWSPHSGSATATVLVSSRFDSLKKLGFFCLSNINVITIVTKGRKNTARKLLVVDFSPATSINVIPRYSMSQKKTWSRISAALAP
ncbi:hypothetical protein V8G54_007381 [Vigna mungo]|uniref:Uncharacterized protein n=1 Tax=Vigna mungo TaxID=3915 RepID=A0AAQ3S908_VIGMU